jgi:Sulfotransferase domain
LPPVIQSRPDPAIRNRDGMRALDFFVIGVQKGGTTALTHYLRRAPFVRLPVVKEIHFFDDDSADWSDPDYGRLHANFEWSENPAVVRGEVTPIYMYWPNAMERIRRYNPAAKLIVCLRHPAYRAYSHWWMETRRGDETLPFEEAISEAGRSRVRCSVGGVHRVYSYVERGLYAGQIRRLQGLFSPRQLLFLKTDALWETMEETLSRIHRFLEIGPPLSMEKAYVTPYDNEGIDTIPEAALSSLNRIFAADIGETSRLTGLSLSDWLEPDYREPFSRAELSRAAT